MRVVSIALVLAGCGFTPSTAATQTGDDGGGSVVLDAPSEGSTVTTPDAKVFHDAPPCEDDDHDGVCNAVDDWPCGVKPAAPANAIDLAINGGASDFKLSNVSIGTTNSTLAVIGHGQALELKMKVDAKDSACPQACIDQLEVGWHPTGHRFACIFDQGVNSGGTSQTLDATHDSSGSHAGLTVPTTPGVYELRVNVGQRNGCYISRGQGDSAMDYDGGTEPSDVIAKLCVN